MPNPRVAPEVRERRKNAMRPILEYLETRGIRHSWLARHLGMSQQRLWTYEEGIIEPPDWLIPRIWEILNNPPPPPATSPRRQRRSALTATTTRSPPHDHRRTDDAGHPARPPPASTEPPTAG